MARLRNPRQERYARLVAAGVELTAAYRQAGYRADGVEKRSAALAARKGVAARIGELARAWDCDPGRDSDAGSGADGPGRAWVVARLVETAERALQAVPVIDRKGAPTGEFTYQGTVALRALELLGRELGMFANRKESSEDDVEVLSDEDLERRAIRLAQALGLGRVGDGA